MEAFVAQTATAQVFRPPNTLMVKLGGRIGPIDPAMLAGAEAALNRLSAYFGPWLAEEILHLVAARAGIRADGYNASTAEQLSLRAHEVKSLGATYGFPLITYVAASLCKLIEDPANRLDAPLYLVDAHIDAIAAAARDGVRDLDHPTGRALVGALNDCVRDLI
jgi:hypothetical protein